MYLRMGHVFFLYGSQTWMCMKWKIECTWICGNEIQSVCGRWFWGSSTAGLCLGLNNCWGLVSFYVRSIGFLNRCSWALPGDEEPRQASWVERWQTSVADRKVCPRAVSQAQVHLEEKRNRDHRPRLIRWEWEIPSDLDQRQFPGRALLPVLPPLAVLPSPGSSQYPSVLMWCWASRLLPQTRESSLCSGSSGHYPHLSPLRWLLGATKGQDKKSVEWSL